MNKVILEDLVERIENIELMQTIETLGKSQEISMQLYYFTKNPKEIK